jgi:hypothetical protein
MLNPDILFGIPQIKTTFAGPQVITATGTGFWVSKEGQIYLVSNRHLFDPNRIQGLADAQDYSVQTTEVGLHGFDEKTKRFTDLYGWHRIDIAGEHLKYSPNSDNDIAVIRLSHGFPKPFRIWAIPIGDFATSEDLATNIHPGDHIFIIGYPDTWYDAQNNLPIVRGGFVSSAPQFDYSDVLGRVRGNCIAIEATSFAGSSGSPVITRSKGIKAGPGLAGGDYQPLRVIGVNAGHFPYYWEDKSTQVVRFEHSGISYIYKSTAISETMLSFG